MAVAPDPESPYVGGRTLKWLKVRQRDWLESGRGSVHEAALGRLHPVEDKAPLRLVLLFGDKPPVPHGFEFGQAVSGAADGRL